ncbi:nodule-specific glycine-rich protein 1I [Trifolium pratense]|uniref:Nodule-specific glycine-rich protein 1I n=2 Tax=Trifolium pratense TaxID=57577 RepID=A0A2K3LBB7_TRIPR|nr:eggshell protein 1-like [Trifolium pratense]PNX75835.1 nodule-specific glycine-rich protein 1I [Trifolium pratense]CAJ2653513.1 unnamed protein product [Trifolium pratense]
MKIKSFIFVFFLCAIILVSVVAIRPSKFGKQFDATEEFKTKVGVDGNGGGHGDWVGSGTWGGWGGGGGEEDKEHGGESGDEHEGDWNGSENEAPGWGDEENGGPGGEGVENGEPEEDP